MTTTPEVPMPEPSCYHEGIPTAPLYEHKKLIAYADARCSALQAERDALAEKVKALQDDARRYRWLKKHRLVLLLTGLFGNGCMNKTTDDVDAAIDAAGGDQA